MLEPELKRLTEDENNKSPLAGSRRGGGRRRRLNALIEAKRNALSSQPGFDLNRGVSFMSLSNAMEEG